MSNLSNWNWLWQTYPFELFTACVSSQYYIVWIIDAIRLVLWLLCALSALDFSGCEKSSITNCCCSSSWPYVWLDLMWNMWINELHEIMLTRAVSCIEKHSLTAPRSIVCNTIWNKCLWRAYEPMCTNISLPSCHCDINWNFVTCPTTAPHIFRQLRSVWYLFHYSNYLRPQYNSVWAVIDRSVVVQVVCGHLNMWAPMVDFQNLLACISSGCAPLPSLLLTTIFPPSSPMNHLYSGMGMYFFDLCHMYSLTCYP